tara:strand:- start:915 stop:1106 length:192 start_codon:yes stop_codon:yes gene_type:complete
MNTNERLTGELSSISTQIDDLISRVEKILEKSSLDRTDENAGLLEVERHLRSTRREVNRLMKD